MKFEEEQRQTSRARTCLFGGHCPLLIFDGPCLLLGDINAAPGGFAIGWAEAERWDRTGASGGVLVVKGKTAQCGY